MQDLDLDEKPYMTNAGLAQSHEGCLSCPRLFLMHQISKIRGDDVFSPEVRRAVQKRRDYGETFGLAQKAVLTAVDSGGESLRHLKRVLNNWLTEEQRLNHISDDDKENDLNQIRDLIENQHRGRPSVKRLKSSTELSQTKGKKPVTQNKCGKCGVVGHYAPTCKN
ncbi:protein far1-related sequence 5-like [Gigaspora margarita]|uniref:Protein far1-related sequence 5-like n=1 Tax=Gigaspora margarita TaxID=4874 RepID=A0A8H4ER85_GIGMA|nr:protein far1-related sequence 5-like [Gigaspora margarita]